MTYGHAWQAELSLHKINVDIIMVVFTMTL